MTPPGGRPEIGPAVNIRFGDLLVAVDDFARAHNMSRAAAVRKLVQLGLSAQWCCPTKNNPPTDDSVEG